MTYTTEQNGNYLIRLEKGEELLASLKRFSAELGVQGTVTGLGGSHDLTIGYYNTETQEYEPHRCEGQLYEVANFTGNASAEFVHVHMTIGDKEHKAYAGHVLEAFADPVLEVAFTTTGDFTRLPDEASGLTLLELPNTL